MQNVRLNLILVSLLLLISVCSITIPISAQSGLSNIEEQLKLAKEKVEQIRADPTTTISNLTLDHDLSNKTLTQEQTNQIEKEPQILIRCIERMNLNEDPGSLCNTFADYLSDKCKRFDNLLDYCVGGLLGLYGSKMQEFNVFKKAQLIEEIKKKELKESCNTNPPVFNDSERVKSCMTVTKLNSSYYDRQPLLLSTNSTKDKSDYDVTYHVQFAAKNTGINPITFENVTYAFYKDDEKLSSGCVGKPTGCRSPNSYTIPGLSRDEYQFDYTVGSNQSGIPPFILNGTYYYGRANTTIISEPFSFDIH